MRKGRLIAGLVLIFLMVVIVNAENPLDFFIDYVELVSQSSYEDGSAKFKFRVSAEYNNFCYYSCYWKNNLDPQLHQFILFDTENDLTEGDNFIINLQPNTKEVQGILTVSCTRTGSLGLCGGNSTKEKSFSTNSYGYNGDRNCQSGKESCKVSDDCSCTKEGKSSIGKDIKQCVGIGLSASCQTYCGNGICESDESCSTCSLDCGKCEGVSCIYGSECEGKFCVHEKCSSKPYVQGDSFCDFDLGENCKNSLVDCGCKSSEKCGQTAQCETFCGNGVCEQEEAGICKADCQWCGDGVCSGNENCKVCDLDCGNCKEEEKLGGILNIFKTKEQNKEEVNTQETKLPNSEITGQVISENSTNNKNKSIKIIIIIIIALLTLLVLSYVGRKIWINRGDERSKKMRELKENINRHEKIIKKLEG